MAPVSFTAVGYLAYASKYKSNCPKNNSGNQGTIQSASQVAIGNNIKQIVLQNGDQKGIVDNLNNSNCKHNHINYNNNNNGPTNDNNKQYLVQSAKQNAIGDNNNQYLVQNSDQTSFS